MPKTGSTAVQRTLAGNRQLLAEKGISYPEAGSLGYAHHSLAWAASLDRVPRNGVEPLGRILAALTSEIGTSDTVIISSEALFHLPRRELAPIAEWAGSISESPRVVAYVRTPVSFHEGWYRQLVKSQGYSRTFEEHLIKAPIVSTLHRLRTFRDAFGYDALTVRPYQRTRFSRGDIVSDFRDITGLNEIKLERVKPHLMNPSLDAELTEFKARLHREGMEHSPGLERAFVAWTTSRSVVDRTLFSSTGWQRFATETLDEHVTLLYEFGLPEDLLDSKPERFTETPLSDGSYEQLRRELTNWHPNLKDSDITPD